MSDEEKQEGQKTVVAFVAGLLIGGLLVWVFSGNPETNNDVEQNVDDVNTSETADSNNEVTTSNNNQNDNESDDAVERPTLEVGDGEVEVADQAAGNSVVLDSAVFPTSEGWIAVRSYNDGQLGSILGAARYSEEQGLVPESIPLLAPTTAGRNYAVVFFTEDGDREFNLANDSQIDGLLTEFSAK